MPAYSFRKIIVAGNLLSLCWLAGVFYLLNTKESPQEVHHILRMHRLYWFDKTLSKKYPELGKLPPSRHNTDINLNGIPDDDKIKLAFSEVLVKEIVESNDTIRGLRFNFKDSVTFGTFFSVLTILQENRARYYLAVDFTIWFFERPRQ